VLFEPRAPLGKFFCFILVFRRACNFNWLPYKGFESYWDLQMIDARKEQVFNLKAAGRLFPSFQEGVEGIHYATLKGWVTRGVRGPDGQKIYLEALRLGGRWLTSKEAIIRFMEAQTPQKVEIPAGVPFRSKAKAQEDAEAAERELDKMGV
jgi:hypothetical protein